MMHIIEQIVGQPKSISTADNEVSGVLKEDGGVSQSIELKDNAAYSTVKPPSASSQSIAVNSNVAYGITPATAEPEYDDVNSAVFQL